jgi:UDP-glucose 4-epimerase
MNKNKILVTGGAGYIGSHLAKNLLSWKPKFDNLNSIIQTDWNWRNVHPFGYQNVKT